MRTMNRIWRWVALITVILLVFSAALIGVAYAGGGSVERLMSTTDIADMTKFASREQLEAYVYQAFAIFEKVLSFWK